MTESDIDKFISISLSVGRDSALVQGGGGNTSIKIDNHRMAIKASGISLKDMGSKNSYSVVDYTLIHDYLNGTEIDEDGLVKKIRSCVVATKNKPSIETGFHSLLKKFVIHTHSVYANLLTCSTDGEHIVGELFPDSLWIGYETPGRDLTLAIKRALKSTKAIPGIIFLKNHGLIATGPESDSTLELHNSVNATIMHHFDLSPTTYQPDEMGISFDFIKNHVLFPDQAVYALAGRDILDTQAAKETLWAYRYIINTMEKKGLKPHFLAKEKVGILLEMESEKYRQKVVK